jgi:hypothetical protein
VAAPQGPNTLAAILREPNLPQRSGLPARNLLDRKALDRLFEQAMEVELGREP